MSLAICRSKLIGELTNEFYDLKLGLKQPLLTLRSCPRSIYSFFAESKSDFTGKKWPELQRWIGTTFRSNSPEFPRSSGIRRNSERILQPSLRGVRSTSRMCDAIGGGALVSWLHCGGSILSMMLLVPWCVMSNAIDEQAKRVKCWLVEDCCWREDTKESRINYEKTGGGICHAHDTPIVLHGVS